jgi:rhodanese-related sulfurtransferase
LNLFDLEITAQALRDLRSRQQDHLLIDVREEQERQICAIENSLHIPLGKLFFICEDLPRDKLVVVYCHHGLRSLKGCQLLAERGFDKVKNLKGGIDSWAKEIDKDMAIY